MRIVVLAALLSFVAPHALVAQPSAPVVTKTDVIYGRVEGSALLANLAYPDGPALKPAILSVHGGRWRAGNRADASSIKVAQWAEFGFFAMSIDYRLVGGSPAPAPYLDLLCAIRWLHAHAEEYRIDPERIYLIGQSAGGQMVSLVATLGEGGFPRVGGWEKARSDVRAVISVAATYELNSLSWGNLWTPVDRQRPRGAPRRLAHHSRQRHDQAHAGHPLRRRQVRAGAAGRGHGREADGGRRDAPLRALHRSRPHGHHRRRDQGSARVHRRGRGEEVAPASRRRGPARARGPRDRARSPSRDTTMAATPLPMKLVSERASDMKRSMPRISARPATGIDGTTASVAASVMKPAPVTPEAPFDVSIATPSSVSCCVSVRSMFSACATNSAAIVR